MENFELNQPLSPEKNIEFIETIGDLANTLDYYCIRLSAWADNHVEKCNQMMREDNNIRLDVRYLKKIIMATALRYTKGCRLISIGCGIELPEPGVEDPADIDPEEQDRHADWIASDILDIAFSSSVNLKCAMGVQRISTSEKLVDAEQARAGLREIHSGTLTFVLSCDVARWIRWYWPDEWPQNPKKDKDV